MTIRFIAAMLSAIFVSLVLAYSIPAQTCSQGMICSKPLPADATMTPGYKPNVFGPGIDMTNTGQPMVWRTQSGSKPPIGTQVIPDLFGPGVGMDILGRPVRAYPAGTDGD